jgi:RNA polymerase sporulation-specific sigma factor
LAQGSESHEDREPGHSRLRDEGVVQLAQAGDAEALLTLIDRYREFVRLKTRSYFLIGADREDIVQEGMIGLFKAIRDYRKDRDTSFKAFAEICITRQIITAVKTATRQKHAPLNSYVSLNNPAIDVEEPDRPVVDVLASREALDPADLVISTEEALSIKNSFAKMLSRLEAEVLKLYIDGRSYQEIAVDLDRRVKSIDNALQRIKRKVERHLQRRESLAQEAVKKPA